MRSLVFLVSVLCFGVCSLFANDSFSVDRLDGFFNAFTEQQKKELNQAGLPTSFTTNPVTPIPPPLPPVLPLPPAPVSGMLPVVITNDTGLPADQVYVTLEGQQVAGSTEYFFELNSDNGTFSPIEATAITYSPNYSYLLSNFPKSTTGANDYLAYVPTLNGARFYFSIKRPMYLQSDTPNSIAAPTYYAFYDPNYNTLFESIEVTFKPTGGGNPPAIPWTASVNTTEVDAFCLPIRISYFSFDPLDPNAVTPMIQDPNALPSGFGVGGASGATTRSGILTSVINNGLVSGDQSGVTPPVWPRIAIPFYSDPYNGTGLQTHLRVLSPKQSLGNNPAPPELGGLTIHHIGSVDDTGIPPFKNYNYPPFPANYFSGGYGAPTTFSDSLFNHYTGGTKLYLSTGGGSPTVYEGETTGSSPNYTLTLTGISGPNMGQVNTLAQSDLNTFKMYSGSQPFVGGSDGVDLGFFFGDAFTVGMLPSTVGTAMGTPINITDATPSGWQETNVPNYYLPENSAVTGGPWYSLYAKELHKVAVRNPSTTFLNEQGLCYAFDFDDSLGISGTITPVITTPNSLNPYLGITLGGIDTAIPDPYSDPNTYDVTFTFPAGDRTLSYQQGEGAVIPVTSGETVSNLVSNESNPLRIFYTYQGKSTQFLVYLYYQILIPELKYSSDEISVINSTPIIPNSPTPTSFTIPLLP